MKVPVTVHHSRIGSTLHRIIRPARPIRGATLRASSGEWLMLPCTDSGEVMRIAALWHLAARSRRSLVHIPLRADPIALHDSPPRWQGPPLDLLLVHHSLRFRPARWKQVRARADRGRPHTADTGTNMREQFTRLTGSYRHPGDRDVLDLSVHADTVVITGSAAALREGAYPFLHVGMRGEAAVRTGDSPGYLTASLHPLDGLLRRPAGTGVLLYYTSPWLDRHGGTADRPC